MSAPGVVGLGSGAMDGWQIALVKGLRHRVGDRHECKCEECRAIVRVCALATERLAIPPVRRTVRKAHEKNAHLKAVLLHLLNRHTEMVRSGDCGHWDVEQESEVIAARAALAISVEGV